MARPNETQIKRIEEIASKKVISKYDINELIEIKNSLPRGQKSQVDGALRFIAKKGPGNSPELARAALHRQYAVKTNSSEQTVKSLYENAIKEMEKEVIGATNYRQAEIARIQNQISNILDDLENKTEDTVETITKKHYTEGSRKATIELKQAGFPVQTSFNQIDKRAIRAIANESFFNFAESISGAKRSTERTLSRARKERIQAIFAEGRITGKTQKEIKGAIVEELEKGFIALRDKGGREWKLDNYAKMLTRTKAVESHNRGLANRLVDEGYDLVKTSFHGGACPLCIPWEDKILSVTGNSSKYPSLREAQSDGMFHPNCRHSFAPYHESLTEITEVYNPYTGEYVPSSEPKPLHEKTPDYTVVDDFRIPKKKDLSTWAHNYFNRSFSIMPDVNEEFEPIPRKVDVSKIQKPVYMSDSKVDKLVRDIDNGMKIPPVTLVRYKGDKTYTIFDGNHRMEALRRLKRKNIPVIFLKPK